MKGVDLLNIHTWKPFSFFGIEHPFFSINAHTVTYTWIILLILFAILLPVRWILKNKQSLGRFAVTSFVETFMQLTEQTLGRFSFKHFSFITAIFTFIFMCNTISIIPWMDEPTKDLNTTLALGLISFFYTQTYAIKSQGIINYIKEFFAPFFLMLPLNIIGKLATIVSISFRLFGNIFGGSIIGQIYFNTIKGSLIGESLGLLTGVNFGIMIFFSLFEGFLQAFVFAMLSLTYLSIETQTGEE